MRILFTSVGRRVELIQAFKEAANKLNTPLEIYGADLVNDAPALYFCDKQIMVPRISDPKYIDTLLTVCKKEKINCLIPTIDTDLLLLSENKTRFEDINTKVFISSYDKVLLCRDKSLTSDYFRSLGLNSPSAVDNIADYSGGFPAFIKPKDGSSSINAFKVETYKQLENYANQIEEYVIQPFVSGKEYTIDIFCDYYGNPIFITPRERLAVRSGEVLKTKICQNQEMIEEMKKLVSDFKPSGAITVQLIQNELDNKNYYIEINPRFGGGSPLSIKAGADSAAEAIRVINNEKTCFIENAAKDGLIFSRFDQSICINGEHNL